MPLFGRHLDDETPATTRLERIARRSAKTLLLETNRWIHRRVERVEYTDSELLKWQFSVDFTIEENFVPFELNSGRPNVYFVPLALLRKWPPLMNLDLRDDRGRPIPLLTGEKNRRIDAEVLVGLLPANSQLSGLEETVREVALSLSKEEAEACITDLAITIENEVDNLSDEELDDWMRIVVLAANLGWNSILWARVSSYPGERQIVKAAFQEHAPPSGPFRKRLLPSFGLRGNWLRLDLHNLGERGSYHLEFVPPPGTDVLEARLQIRDPLLLWPDPPKWWNLREHFARARKRRAKRFVGPALKRGARRVLRSGDETAILPQPEWPYSHNLLSRAHFYVAESSGQRGKALIRLGPTRRDFLTGALYAAILTTALLWFSYALTPRLVETQHIAPTVTALLVLPALLSYLFTQPLPHPVARRMIAGIRVVARSVTLLPVIAALLMLALTTAEKPDVPLIEAWWKWLAIGSSIFTLLLAVSAKVLPLAAVGELYGPIDGRDATA